MQCKVFVDSSEHDRNSINECTATSHQRMRELQFCCNGIVAWNRATKLPEPSTLPDAKILLLE